MTSQCHAWGSVFQPTHAIKVAATTATNQAVSITVHLTGHTIQIFLRAIHIISSSGPTCWPGKETCCRRNPKWVGAGHPPYHNGQNPFQGGPDPTIPPYYLGLDDPYLWWTYPFSSGSRWDVLLGLRHQGETVKSVHPVLMVRGEQGEQGNRGEKGEKVAKESKGRKATKTAKVGMRLPEPQGPKTIQIST